MPSIFSRIIAGAIPCEKIFEDDQFFAFLDIRPINPGHTLVVPKFEVDEIFDLDKAWLANFLPFAKIVASALKKSVPCKRIGVLVAGFEVPHAHLHLVPIHSEGELNFERARPAQGEMLSLLAEKIRGNL